MPDPTRPLADRTREEVAAYVDDHLIMALMAAESLHADDGTSLDLKDPRHPRTLTVRRGRAEDLLRARIRALSDSWPQPGELAQEDTRRRTGRLGAMLRSMR